MEAKSLLMEANKSLLRSSSPYTNICFFNSSSSIKFKTTQLGFGQQITTRFNIKWKSLKTLTSVENGPLMGGGGDEEEVVVVVVRERYKVAGLMTFVMCLCNADRVVMSVAVVPLAAKYGWSTSFLDVVQGYFVLLSWMPIYFKTVSP